MYHPKVETQRKIHQSKVRKIHQSKIDLQERINNNRERERERERTITFIGRECETNNKII